MFITGNRTGMYKGERKTKSGSAQSMSSSLREQTKIFETSIVFTLNQLTNNECQMHAVDSHRLGHVHSS